MKKYSILFLLCLLPLFAQAESVEIDGIYYNLNGTEAEVTNNKGGSWDGDNSYSGIVNIPESVYYSVTGETYSVTSIGYAAFSFCNLTSVTIPNSVTSIGDYAFVYCSSLTSVTIPNSVTEIGNQAFSQCSSLTSVTIPNSVISIGKEAFYNCSGLISVTIPNSVTHLGYGAFQYCSSLTSIIVASGNTVYDSRDNCNAIIETNSNTLVAGCKNTIILGCVNRIGESAFSGCSGLTSVTIPNSVTAIDENAFSDCRSLTSVTIPNSVTAIGDFSFAHCSGLTSVTIPGSVTTIGDYSFCMCSQLTSVTIGSGITSIGEWAFADCSRMKHVYCYAINVPSTDPDAFENIYIQSATLHVPESALEDYSKTVPWSGFGNIVPLSAVPTGLTEVASVPVQVKSRGGVITVEGLDDNTLVTVYTAGGALVGTATAVNHTAILPTRLMPGSVAIVKMGGKNVKMVVR